MLKRFLRLQVYFLAGFFLVYLLFFDKGKVDIYLFLSSFLVSTVAGGLFLLIYSKNKQRTKIAN